MLIYWGLIWFVSSHLFPSRIFHKHYLLVVVCRLSRLFLSFLGWLHSKNCDSSSLLWELRNAIISRIKAVLVRTRLCFRTNIWNAIIPSRAWIANAKSSQYPRPAFLYWIELYFSNHHYIFRQQCQYQTYVITMIQKKLVVWMRLYHRLFRKAHEHKIT